MDERRVLRPGCNPYACYYGEAFSAPDPGMPDGGAVEEAGLFFLLPYWMGRYYGFIGAP